MVTIYDYLSIPSGVHQRQKVGHFYSIGVITRIAEKHYRGTVGCLLYTSASPPREGLAVAQDDARARHQILPRTAMCFCERDRVGPSAG